MFKKIPDADYFGNSSISQSDLKHLKKSPAHFKYNKENPTEATPAMELGTAIHTALLEPENFSDVCVKAPEGLTPYHKAYKEMRAANPTKIIVSCENWEHINQIKLQFNKHTLAKGLLYQAQIEHALFWEDKETGIPLKGKFDIVNPETKIIADIKTTESAAKSDFFYSIKKYAYDFQAAFYLKAMKQLTGEDFKFFIIAIEKTPPYGIQVFRIGPNLISSGEAQVRYCLERLSYCLRENRWPNYPLDYADIDVDGEVRLENN